MRLSFPRTTLFVGLVACHGARSPSPSADAGIAAPIVDGDGGRAPAFAFVDVCVSGSRSCAAGNDGSAYCWGDGMAERPVRVDALRSVERVRCSESHTCTRDTRGAISCVRHGPPPARPNERLGFADLVGESVTGIPPASDLVLTPHGGCAIAAGELWCWRWEHASGQPDELAVAEPIEGVSDVVRLRAAAARSIGADRVCAVRRGGPPLCVHLATFASGAPKALAGAMPVAPPPASTVFEREAPLIGLEAARDVVPIGAAPDVCAVLADGSTTCTVEWPRMALASALGKERTRELFAGGTDRVCARLESGEPRCARLGAEGAARDEAVDAVRALGVPSVLAIGEEHACATTASGLYCWGAASDGQLGDGTAYDHPRAVKVPGIADAARLSVGRELTCVARRSGALACWGAWDDEGSARGRERDVFAASDVEAPKAITGVFSGSRLSNVLCVEAASGPSCRLGDEWSPVVVPRARVRQLADRALLTDDMRARTFGWENGRLLTEPHDIDKAGVRLASLSPDGQCGVTPDGDIVCAHCGACSVAEAKRALTRIHGSHKMVEVTSLLSGWEPLGAIVCGRTEAGAIECYRGEEMPWKSDPHPVRVLEPLSASLRDVVHVAGEGRRYEPNLLCALDQRGAVHCLGDNRHGQRGIGGADAAPPGEGPAIRAVVDLPPAVELGVAGDHACARTAAGEVFCWGSNRRGAVPDGAPRVRSSAVRVAAPLAGTAP